jgi:hypothetical protein
MRYLPLDEPAYRFIKLLVYKGEVLFGLGFLENPPCPLCHDDALVL